jgi:hypothetical protein
MHIDELSDVHLGTYGCYAYASTGTIRQTLEIKELANHEGAYHIVVNKPGKRIKLSIEQVRNNEDAEFTLKGVIKLGEKYQFDCISGNYWLCF